VRIVDTGSAMITARSIIFTLSTLEQQLSITRWYDASILIKPAVCVLSQEEIIRRKSTVTAHCGKNP